MYICISQPKVILDIHIQRSIHEIMKSDGVGIYPKDSVFFLLNNRENCQVEASNGIILIAINIHIIKRKEYIKNISYLHRVKKKKKNGNSIYADIIF